MSACELDDPVSQPRLEEGVTFVLNASDPREEAHRDVGPEVLPHERHDTDVRRELVGRVATAVVSTQATPVELVLGHQALGRLDVREQRGDPARDVLASGVLLVLVQRAPELLVDFTAGSGVRDGSEHVQQVDEVGLEAHEHRLKLVCALIQRQPVLGRTLQADLGDVAHGLHRELVVRTDHVHQRHKGADLVLLGRGRERRYEQVVPFAADVGLDLGVEQRDGFVPR